MITEFKERVLSKLLDDISDPYEADFIFHEVQQGIVSNLSKLELTNNDSNSLDETLSSLQSIFWDYGLYDEGDEIAIFQQRFKNGEKEVITHLKSYTQELQRFVA